MAGTKISDLPSAGALTGAELVPVVQSDVTKKTTITDILTSAGAGTVTSVDVSGGTTGLTATGGPITTTGTITLGGTLDVDNGGTGATTAANARTNLDVPSRSGSGASGTWAIDITGNAGTVTDGVYTSGSYANPSWITSLAGSKITGNISGNAAGLTSTLSTGTGGTGQTTYTNGQLLIGNASGSLSKATLTAGSNVTITNGDGTITIAATSGGSGTVTSVNASGGTTGLTFSGGPITSSGTLTMAGTLDADNGGTGQTSYTNGQILIGNSAGGLTKATLTAGSGISITNGNGSITLTAAGSGLGDVTGPASATDNAVARFDGTTGKIIKNTSDFIIDGSNNVGIGGTTSSDTKVNISGVLPVSGTGYSYAFGNRGTVASTVTNPATGVLSELNTQASGLSYTVGTYYHFAAKNGALGSNSVVNNQVGYWAEDFTLGQAVFGYISSVNAGTNKWGLYFSGDAKNYFKGNVGIGNGNDNPGSALDVKGTIRLSGSTSGYVGLAPAAAAGSTTYTLPSADGTSGQVLKTDGAGALSWTSVGGTGTVTSVNVSGGTTGLTTSGGPVTGSGTITIAGTLNVANGGTGVTSSSGANSVVLRDSNQNIAVNSVVENFTTITASGTPVVLTVSSAPSYLVSGSGGQTIQLPDATTLNNGVTYAFNNNQSSGAITVNNNSSTLIASVPSGGYVVITLLSNSTAAGTWDRHDQTPSNVSWSINTFDYPGSITSATWNGAVVATNRGGTGLSSFTSGGAVYASSTSVLTTGTLPVASGGTGLTAGTSGGVLYYSATGTLASSSALAANALVIGGGAGTAPSTITTGTGVVTALGVNTGSAGAFVVNGGALGTPSSGTLTNATGLPVSTGISGLGTNVATFLATPSSANLAAAVTDETGSGSLVFATSPTLTTPILGTPTSGNLSNCTADGTNAVGFKNIPQSGSDKVTSYTLATTDVGKFIGVGTSGSIVVPNSTFAAGDVVSIFNNTTGNVTITTNPTSSYIAGANTTKSSVTLATRGVATILFISGTVCVISGNVS